MFGVVYAPEGSSIEVLIAVARDFSPRIEVCSDREVMLDLQGLERLIGDPPTIAAALRRTAAERGLQVRVAIAGTRTAARLLVHAHPGLTIVEPGDERLALSSLPLDLIAVVTNDPNDPNDRNNRNDRNDRNDRNSNVSNPSNVPNVSNLLTLRRWGLRTLGDLAELPDDAVAARLGQRGVAWQRLARGADHSPLVPALPEERFEESLDLEWPIEELEPLSFVLGRLLEPLSAHLEKRDRGAAVLHVRLHLIKRDGVTREVYERSLQLPAPIRDARTLRTLALLDLESNPPSAPIDRVVVAVDPTPARVVQYSLLTRPLPSPEQLSTLMARLTALMGEGRCGSPEELDAWRPGAFGMRPFVPRETDQIPPLDRARGGLSESRRPNPKFQIPTACSLRSTAEHPPPTALRRFRHPIPVRVRLEEGAPMRVTTDRRGLAGGRVATCAGPWRTSGAWWDSQPWNRDEWDVTVAEGGTYRMFHDRSSGNWFLDGIVD